MPSKFHVEKKEKASVIHKSPQIHLDEINKEDFGDLKKKEVTTDDGTDTKRT